MAIGVDPAAVGDVIISHMHYDHAGNNDLFPNATFHLQEPGLDGIAVRLDVPPQG
ncbi:MAG TPA: MBL fold metallo-hydrolase [Stellaceae bacterium]|nr:MBL fold metallo-hydrolase [Stellaceae bacterium]